MMFAAEVTTLQSRKKNSTAVMDVVADDEPSAARKIADVAARRRYGDKGESSWIVAQKGRRGEYLSFIGVGGFHPGEYRLDGVTIRIRLRPMAG